jgi:RNA recognition motif-containing protein
MMIEGTDENADLLQGVQQQQFCYALTTKKDRRSRSRSKERRQRSYSRSKSPSEPGTVLYVHGLDPKMTADDLKKYFSQFGTVVKSSVVSDPRTKLNRGFGFVTMSSVEEMNAALDKASTAQIDGLPITVEKVCTFCHLFL